VDRVKRAVLVAIVSESRRCADHGYGDGCFGAAAGVTRPSSASRYTHRARPSVPGKPSATTPASSINASRVSRFNSSRLISAPVSR
jgi:hypothetical protein